MRAQPSPDMRTAPGRGPSAATAVDWECQLDNVVSRHIQVQGLVELDDDIETAEAYERILALRQYRVRKLILNLKIKRDWLIDFGDALAGRRAA